MVPRRAHAPRRLPVACDCGRCTAAIATQCSFTPSSYDQPRRPYCHTAGGAWTARPNQLALSGVVFLVRTATLVGAFACRDSWRPKAEGTGVGDSKVKGIAACEAECLATAGCNAFAWNVVDADTGVGDCHLKRGFDASAATKADGGSYDFCYLKGTHAPALLLHTARSTEARALAHTHTYTYIHTRARARGRTHTHARQVCPYLVMSTSSLKTAHSPPLCRLIAACPHAKAHPTLTLATAMSSAITGGQTSATTPNKRLSSSVRACATPIPSAPTTPTSKTANCVG